MDKVTELELEIKYLKEKVKSLENELKKRPTIEEVDAKIKQISDWAIRTFPTC